MERQNKFIFHNRYDLKGLVYNLDRLSKYAKGNRSLSRRIINLGGKISFNISVDTIIILEQINTVKIQRELINNNEFDKAVIYDNNEIRFVINEKNTKMLNQAEIAKNLSLSDRQLKREYKEDDNYSKEKVLRVIKLNYFDEIMNGLEKNSIDKHFILGLPENFDSNATISLIIPPNDTKKNMSLHYYTFEYLTLQETNKNYCIRYCDVPRYVKSSPEGFSLFITYREKKKINNYMKSITDKTIECIKDEKNTLEDNLHVTPEPHRSNKFCNLCRAQFEKYLEHLESKTHKNNFTSHEYIYTKINQKFEHIREFWKNKSNSSSHGKGEYGICNFKMLEKSLYKIIPDRKYNVKNCQCLLDKEIQIIDLTADENFCRNDSNMINQNINSLIPDIISPSTKILSSEIDRTDKFRLDDCINERHKIKNILNKEDFLRKKRKNDDYSPKKDKKITDFSKSHIVETKNAQSSSNKSILKRSKDFQITNTKRLLRSNIKEKIEDDLSLSIFIKHIFQDEYYYNNLHKNKKK